MSTDKITYNGNNDYSAFETIRSPSWHVNMPWDSVIHQMERWKKDQEDQGDTFELNPDFQRGHVWTEAQQVGYIEWILKGGKTGRDIYFNHPNWRGGYKGVMVLVDGLQRLTAVMRYMRGEIGVFAEKSGVIGGLKVTDFSSRPYNADFVIHICDMKTRAEILQWYIDFNSAGTQHSTDEIERVKSLIGK